MFTRIINTELLQLALGYPVVTIIGPRQSGKTTVVKSVFPSMDYINLELPDVREAAILDPKGFLAKYPNGAILDEIQRAPTLLSYIQVIVDQTLQKGMFILTGSHQLELHQAITQSLAGRTAVLKLFPLSLIELKNSGISLSIDEYLLNGFFPRIYQDQLNPTKVYRNYVQTYVERDVRRIVNVKDLGMFQRFFRLCAGRVGQVLNLHSMSNDLGVSSHTLQNWISILDASFLTFQLQPYFENFGKRIIKSPKLYFTDVGLVCYLLGIENINQLARDPLRGYLIENLIILELIKARSNQGLDPQLYYYRDNHGNEIDVIYKSANTLIPIEIKAAQTLNREFFKGINFFRKLIGERFSHGFLVYTGNYTQEINQCYVINYLDSANIVSEY